METKGDLPAARAAFEKVVRLAPNAPEGHNSLGWVLLKTGNPDEAVAHLRAAVKLKPAFVQAHINLANALAVKRDRQGAIEAAINEARTAVKLAPSDSEAHRTLGRMLSFQQNVNGAISELASRRSEFGAILKSGGPDALVNLLMRQGDKLLAGRS